MNATVVGQLMRVGEVVGVDVGATEGLLLGWSVGDCVGKRVGASEGWSVGVRVGADVGGLVGSAVGELEGGRVGAFDGRRVGRDVGADVGGSLGFVVGYFGQAPQLAPSSRNAATPLETTHTVNLSLHILTFPFAHVFSAELGQLISVGEAVGVDVGATEGVLLGWCVGD
jgi:hypothetical protein